MPEKRPRVRIRFKYNMDTGEIEEFIIDDNAPGASEAYHDKVARAVAGRLGRRLDIREAGDIRLADEDRRQAAHRRQTTGETETPPDGENRKTETE